MPKKLFQILLIAAMLCPNVVLAGTTGGVSKKDQTTTGTTSPSVKSKEVCQEICGVNGCAWSCPR